MTIREKTELLRYKLLHNRFNYDIDIYGLLTFDKMKDEISRINELSFSFNVELEKNEITAMQFLLYMNNFIKYMKTYFFNIPFLHNMLDDILKGSKNELNNLLDYRYEDPYDYYELKKDKIVKEKIYKLIISNFINNAKYIPSIEIVLKENNISLKSVENYSLDESEKILILLSDIAFCQRSQTLISELFDNIDIHLTEYLEKKSKSKSKKYTIEDYEKRFIDSYRENYEKMFSTYNIRKPYLKYFMKSKKD